MIRNAQVGDLVEIISHTAIARTTWITIDGNRVLEGDWCADNGMTGEVGEVFRRAGKMVSISVLLDPPNVGKIRFRAKELRRRE